MLCFPHLGIDNDFLFLFALSPTNYIANPAWILLQMQNIWPHPTPAELEPEFLTRHLPTPTPTPAEFYGH